MARYAELYFAEKEEDIPINPYLMKLPDSIRNKIIKWKIGLSYQEANIWQVNGDQVQIPMTYTMYRKMPASLRGDIFKKIEKKLEQRDVTHVILPKLISISPFENIKQCRGDRIKAFFIMNIIDFIVKEQIINKSMQHLEVIVLDGNKNDVDIIIDLVYPHINHLTIISSQPERFQEKAEDIFNDVGLNMQVLSYTKGAIAQGDIIIDTHYDDPSVIRFCKPGSLYLDLGNHAEKTLMLLERQQGVPVIDGFSLVKEGEVVTPAKAELLLTIQRLLSHDYQETMKRLKKQNIKIYNLRNQNHCLTSHN